MSDAFELLKNPFFVALDIDDKSLIQKIVRETADLTGGFKIGPRLVFRFGTKMIEEIAERAPVFLDFKFYDIPSTMDAAIRGAFGAGVSFATVHAVAGSGALEQLSKTEKELQKQKPFSILGVTILTSYSESNLPPNFQNTPISDQVESLTRLLSASGIKGAVCSPHEVQNLKKQFKDVHFVTPGIRLASDSKDDQLRTATPGEALKWGSSALVVGRSLLQSPDPRKYLQNLIQEL